MLSCALRGFLQPASADAVLVSVCLFIRDRNKGYTVEYSSGNNVWWCSGSFGGCPSVRGSVRPSVCPSVRMSVHLSVRPSVRPSGQINFQGFTWQLRSHLQVIKRTLTEHQIEYHTEYNIEYQWVPKLILPEFHIEYHTKNQWVTCWVLLSTAEYHWVPHWVPLNTMWKLWMAGRAGCVIALSMPSS